MDIEKFNELMSRMRLIIFDLGGVLIDIDIAASATAFARLGIDNLEHHITQSHASSGFFGLFERGLITPDEFCTQVRNTSHICPTNAQIIEAWNAMLGSFPAEKVKIIERLRRSKKVALLSNTNALHYEAFAPSVPGYSSIDLLFDSTHYSHTLHLSKPDPEIYLSVLRHHGVSPSETLFLDDSEKNIAAANTLGINTLLVTKECGIEMLSCPT